MQIYTFFFKIKTFSVKNLVSRRNSDGGFRNVRGGRNRNETKTGLENGNEYETD